VAKEEKLLSKLQLYGLRIENREVVQQMQEVAPLSPAVSPTSIYAWRAVLDPHLLGLLPSLRPTRATNRNQMISITHYYICFISYVKHR
jgi:hypothetical protein